MYKSSIEIVSYRWLAILTSGELSHKQHQEELLEIVYDNFLAMI